MIRDISTEIFIPTLSIEVYASIEEAYFVEDWACLPVFCIQRIPLFFF